VRYQLILALALLGCGGEKTDKAGAKGSAAATVKAREPVAAFWKWFVEASAGLRAGDARETMNRISDELKKIDQGVFAEIRIQGEDRTLVITADGNRKLFPIVEEIFAARPTVAGWDIVAFRQRAKDGEPALRVEMSGKKLDAENVKFVGKSGGELKLDIDVFMPGFTNEKDMAQVGYVLLDHVVGEYDMETKIGAITFAPIAKAPDAAKPLKDLPAIVDALK
jgi:hypothetical protein